MDSRKGGTGMIMKATFTLGLPGLIMIIVLFALCLLFPAETTKDRIIIASVAAATISITVAAHHNPTAEFTDMVSKSPRISSRYETKDGRPVISLKYNLTAATSGKYHISGKLKIHDSMTGKNWTVSAQNDVFSTGADEDTPFLLLYAVPKELADKNITDASYTVRYASG